MLFPLLLQGPGIEPWKSALKVDTLTTDLLGTIYTGVEIFSSDKAFEESLNSCLWTRLFSCSCPLKYFVQLIWRKHTLLLVEKVYCFLIGAAPFTIFFNYRSEAQHIGMPTFMLVKRAYCFLATAAIFSIYLNYRGEAQHIGINLKHPL